MTEPYLAPTLHVVYAGYGDALILEYSTLADGDTFAQRRLVLVDGGPKSLSIRGRGAPYPKYFMHAIRQVWADMVSVSARHPGHFHQLDATAPHPTAIINSHAHLDHYEGLLAYLRADADRAGGPAFTGPFYLPRPRAFPSEDGKKGTVMAPNSSDGRSVQEIEAILTNVGYHHEARTDETGVGTFAVAGLSALYPLDDPAKPGEPVEPSSIVKYVPNPDAATAADGTRPQMPWVGDYSADPLSWLDVRRSLDTEAPVPSALFPRSISAGVKADESAANVSGILLETAAATGGRVLLTGDNVGWVIKGACFAPDPDDNNYAIYKIAHHGSINNSLPARGTPHVLPTAMLNVIAFEAAVREVLEVGQVKELQGTVGEPAYHSRDFVGLESTARIEEDDEPEEEVAAPVAVQAVGATTDIETEMLVEKPPEEDKFPVLPQNTHVQDGPGYPPRRPTPERVQEFSTIVAKVLQAKGGTSAPAEYVETLRARHAVYLHYVRNLPIASTPDELAKAQADLVKALPDLAFDPQVILKAAHEALLELLTQPRRPGVTSGILASGQEYDVGDGYRLSRWRYDNYWAPKGGAADTTPRKATDMQYGVYQGDKVIVLPGLGGDGTRAEGQLRRSTRDKKEVKPHSEAQAKEDFKAQKDKTTPGSWKLHAQEWLAELMPAAETPAIWLRQYRAVRAATLARAFYKSFRAKAYVVSANGTHNHPSVATLAGLAAALFDQRRKATLYITSGQSVHVSRLMALAQWTLAPADIALLADDGTPLIGPTGFLRIRYMNTLGVHMSIAGATDWPVDAHGFELSRDMRGRTEDLVLGDSEKDAREVLAMLMEHDTSVLPAHSIVSKQYEIVCLDDFGNVYRYVEFDERGTPRLTTDPASYTMWERWQLLGWKYEPQAWQHVFAQLPDTAGDEPGVGRPGGGVLLQVNGTSATSYAMSSRSVIEEGEGSTMDPKTYVFVIGSQGGLMDLPTPLVVPLQHPLEEGIELETPGGYMYVKHLPLYLRPVAPPLAAGAGAHGRMMAQVVEFADDGGTDEGELSLRALSLDVDNGPQAGHQAAPQQPTSIQAFLAASGITADPSAWTVLDALTAIIGAENASKLGLGAGISGAEGAALSYAIDTASSIVNFAASGAGATVTSADLRASLRGRESISVQGGILQVTAATLAVQWPPSGPLECTLSIVLDNSIPLHFAGDTTVTLAFSHKLDGNELHSQGTGSLLQLLAQVCQEAGIEEPNLAAVSLPKLLGYLTGWGPATTAAVFARHAPAAAMSAGLLALTPDMERSRVMASIGPTGRTTIHAVDIVCRLTSFSEAAQAVASALAVAGLAVQLHDVRIVLENPRTPLAVMNLTGGVTINSLALAFTVALTGPGSAKRADRAAVLWEFSAAGATATLPQISALWAAAPQSFDTTPPLARSPLSRLTSTGVGFVLAQPVRGSAGCVLRSIYAAVDFEDWKSFMPQAFPLPAGAAGSIRVEVRNPLEDSLRAYATIIDFSTDITAAVSGGVSRLQVTLTAEPVVGPTDYEFRLWATASGGGITAPEVLAAVGLGARIGQLTQHVPLVARVLDSLRLKSLSVDLVPRAEGGRMQMGGYSVSLAATELAIIPDYLVLRDVELDLRSELGIMQCSASGSIEIARIKLQMQIDLPRADTPGLITINAPRDLYVDQLLSYFYIAGVDVPVLAPTLDNVLLASVALTLKPTAAGVTSTSIMSVEATFSATDFAIGGLTFSYAEARIMHHTKDGVYDPPFTSFAISAVAQGKFAANVTYNTHTKSLRAAFEATQVVSIREGISSLLGDGVANALEPLIGDFGVQGAVLSINTETRAVEIAQIVLLNTSAVTVDGADMALEHLRMEYVAAYAGRPASMELVGSLTGRNQEAQFRIACLVGSSTTLAVSMHPVGDSKLTLSALLSLFGWSMPAVQAPSGLARGSYLDLDIREVSGQVTLAAGKLQLTSLDVAVELAVAVTIFDAPAVVVKRMAVAVHYRRAGGLSGGVSLQVAIGDIDLWVSYENVNGRETFTGDAAFSADLAHVATTLAIPSRDFAVPTSLGLPSVIAINRVGATIVRGKSVEVRAHGGTSWGTTVDGISLSAVSLGGTFKIAQGATDPATGATAQPSYEAYITCALHLSGFQSANAQLSLRSQENNTLTAQLTRDRSVTEPFQTISSQVATAGTTAKWDDLVTYSTLKGQLTNFAPLEIALYVDFTASTLMLAGSVAAHGGALFLAKRNPAPATGHGYYFTLSASNLGSLWPELIVDVGQAFSISQVQVQVVSLDTTLATLQADLARCFAALSATAQRPAISTAGASTTQNANTTISALPADMVVQKGVWFFAQIDARGSNATMSKVISLGLDQSSTPALLLWANVDRVDPHKSSYAIQVRDFGLYGGMITINGIGSYVPGTSLAKVDGTLLLRGLRQTPLSFDVTLRMEPNTTSFKLTNTPSDTSELQDPFRGNMFNITLTKLALSGEIIYTPATDKTSREYTLTGSVKINGQTDTRVDGSVIFVQGVPKIASLTYNRSQVPITEVFNSIIKPGSARAQDWPEAYVPFNLESVELYYAVSDSVAIDYIDVKGKRYMTGYNIRAALVILGRRFVINVELPSDRQGVKVTGTYAQAADLGFAQIVGYTDSDGAQREGATVLIDTTTNPVVYSVTAGFTLFGCPGFKLSLKYLAPDVGLPDWGLQGTASYSGTLLGAKDPTINFTYRAGKIDMSGWQVEQNAPEDFDLVKEIQKAALEEDPNSCGNLVGLVFDKVVVTRFKFSVGLHQDDNPDAPPSSVTLMVKWVYEVTILTVKVSVDMPDFPLVFTGPFEGGKLLTALMNSVKTSFTAIGKKLLQQPAKLKNLMLAIAVETYGKALIQTLLCRGIDSDNIKKRAEKLTEEERNQKEEEFKEKDTELEEAFKATENALEVLGGLSSAGAVAGGLASAVGAFGTALSVLGALGAILGGLLSILGFGPSDEEHRKKMEANNRRKAQLQAQIDAHRQKVRDAIKLTQTPTTTFTGLDTVKVDWTASLPNPPVYAGETYKEVQFLIKWCTTNDRNHASAIQTTYTTLTKQFSTEKQVAEWGRVGTVYVWVSSYVDAGSERISSDWVAANPAVHTIQLPLPAVPGIKVTSTTTETFTVTIKTPTTGTYKVSIGEGDLPDGQSRYNTSTTVPSPAPTEWTFTVAGALIADALPAGVTTAVLIAHVKLVSSQPAVWTDSAWAASQDRVTLVKAPVGLTGSIHPASQRITVQWQQPGALGAKDYTVTVLRSTNVVDTPKQETTVTAPAGQRKVELQPTDLGAGQITVQVRAAFKPAATVLSLAAKVVVTIPVLTYPQSTAPLTAPEVAFLQSADARPDLFIYGTPVGGLGGAFFTMSPGLAAKPGMFPKAVTTTAYPILANTLALSEARIGFDSGDTLSVKSVKTGALTTRDVQGLVAGERIVRVDVHTMPSGVQGFSLFTNAKREFPVLLLASAPTTKTEFAMPPGSSGLRGFWGHAGDYFDRVGPIWGRGPPDATALAPILIASTGPIVKNGEFATGNFDGWNILPGGGTTQISIASPGIDGAAYKVVANVTNVPAKGAYSGTCLQQFIDVIPGAQYRLTVKWKYMTNDNNTYFNIFVDGQYVISARSTTSEKVVRTATNIFTPTKTPVSLDLNLTSTWYKNMAWEIASCKCEKV